MKAKPFEKHTEADLWLLIAWASIRNDALLLQIKENKELEKKCRKRLKELRNEKR